MSEKISESEARAVLYGAPTSDAKVIESLTQLGLNAGAARNLVSQVRSGADLDAAITLATPLGESYRITHPHEIRKVLEPLAPVRESASEKADDAMVHKLHAAMLAMWPNAHVSEAIAKLSGIRARAIREGIPLDLLPREVDRECATLYRIADGCKK